MSKIPQDIKQVVLKMVISSKPWALHADQMDAVEDAILAERKATEARVSAKVEKETLDRCVFEASKVGIMAQTADGIKQSENVRDAIRSLPLIYKEEGEC